MLSLIVILLLGLSAFAHYKHGFFSATLSAIVAGIAAILAFSFHEVVVRSLLKGALGENAAPLMLVVLFAVVYVVCRLALDFAIPSNVAIPHTVNMVGGGVMGLVAGIFAAGIAVIAAQELPFGPAVLGYARLPVKSEPTNIHHANKSQNPMNSMLVSDTIEDAPTQKLFPPVDDIVVGLVSHASRGALAGSQEMSLVHPAFLNELFLQRLGTQAGAKHVAINVPNGDRDVNLNGIFMSTGSLPSADGEPSNLKARWSTPPGKTLAATGGDVILILRTQIGKGAADTDGNVRFGPGAVKLVANGKSYFMRGTYDTFDTPVVRVNRPDDFLIMPADATVDLVFVVPSEALGIDPKGKPPIQIGPKVSLTVKRMGLVELSGMQVKPEVPPPLASGAATIFPKEGLRPAKPKTAPAAPAPEGQSAGAPGAMPVDAAQVKVTVSPDLPMPVETGPRTTPQVTLPSGVGTATVQANKFTVLQIRPTAGTETFSTGDSTLRELSAPAGSKVVQVNTAPPSNAEGAKAWEWADKLGQFELRSASGQGFKVRGAWAALKTAQGEDRAAAAYNQDQDLTALPKAQEHRPTDVTLYFVVPSGTTVNELQLGGQRVGSFNTTVP